MSQSGNCAPGHAAKKKTAVIPEKFAARAAAGPALQSNENILLFRYIRPRDEGRTKTLLKSR